MLKRPRLLGTSERESRKTPVNHSAEVCANLQSSLKWLEIHSVILFPSRGHSVIRTLSECEEAHLMNIDAISKGNLANWVLAYLWIVNFQSSYEWFFKMFIYLFSWICSLLGEGNGTQLQYSCLENPMDGGAWWAAVHGVAKSRTRLSYFTFTFHFHPLEKEMATHSSVLAWRISGTEEPGGLPSMGSHRVRHDWCDLVAAAGFQY